MTKKIEKVAKGNYYETKDHALLVVTNGRLKDEGDLGQSFEGKSVTYDAKKNALVEAKKADRFYLDELVRRLNKKDLEEWLAVEQREAEAAKDAETETEPKPGKKNHRTAGFTQDFDRRIQAAELFVLRRLGFLRDRLMRNGDNGLPWRMPRLFPLPTTRLMS
jgi:hypothetical protein